MKSKRVTQNCFRHAAIALTVLSLFLIPIQAVSEAACLENPGAFWPLEESATPFVDTIGSLPATCSGTAPTVCPTAPATGAVANGLEFNATSTGLDIAASGSSDRPFDWGVADSFSIELWLKTATPKPLSGTMVAVGRLHEGTISLRWFISVDPSTGFAKVSFSDRAGTSVEFLGNAVDLTNGAWHHVAVTRDVATAKIYLYVDGVLENSKAVSFTNGFDSQTQPMTIGYLNTISGSKFHFNGSIDEVAIYDTVLTPQIIKSHYDNGALGQTYCTDVAPSVLTTPEMNMAYIGFPYEGSFMASGNPLPTFALGTTPPTGMTIADAATGEIDWLPLDNQYPTMSVEVTAQNSVSSATQTVPIQLYDLCTDFMAALWPLDEMASPFVDSVAALEATCSGTAPTNCPTLSDTDFILGQAQEFSPTGQTGLNVAADGTSTSVFDWSQADDFSIEVWVKPAASLTGTQVAVGRLHEGSISLRWWLGVRPTGIASAQITDRDGVSSTLLDSRTTPLDLRGDWHLIGLVRDASMNQIRLYVDGELADTQTVLYTDGFNSNTNPLNIGYLNTISGSKFHFTGRIDEVALYNAALPASVFATHYQNGVIGKGYCNSAPMFTTSNPDPVPTTATEGQLYTVDFNATDADPDTLTWSLATAPTGMQIDSDGVVTWTPAAPITSPVSYQVMVQDSQGGTATQIYTVDVTAVTTPASGGSSGGGGGGGGGCFIDSIR